MMDNRLKYQRIFFMFDQEDEGFGIGQKPNGYAKIEVKEGKGKLSVAVQNLQQKDKVNYQVYIIKSDSKNTIPVLTGNMEFNGSHAEHNWKFNPDNVGKSGFDVNEFNIMAIKAEENKEGSFIWPLVAYKDKSIEWRQKVWSYLNGKSKKNEPTRKENNNKYEIDDITSKYEINLTSMYDKKQNNNKKQVNKKQTGINKKENHQYENKQGNLDNATEESKKSNKKDLMSKPLLEGNTNLTDIKEAFDRYFDRHSPFNNRRKDYIWWKVNSPVYLNNVLYKFNIKTPLLFNPKVLMAHFKYRHLTIGLYTDKKTRRKYIVCGIPGALRIDEKPFGDVCRWVQVEGVQPKYGAFGYWLVYIDPSRGKIIGT